MPKTQPLEYQASEPAFLRRLKAGHAALDGRHNAQIPRAHARMGASDRLNMKGEDGDDDPVVLDEDGNLVSREEMQAMRDASSTGAAADQTTSANDNHDGQRATDTKQADDKARDATNQRPRGGHVTSGFGRKRKMAKIIGSEGEGEGQNGETSAKTGRVDKDHDAQGDGPVKSLKDSTKDLRDVVTRNKENATTTKKDDAGVAKKTKRKKIKLSFDEPD